MKATKILAATMALVLFALVTPGSIAEDSSTTETADYYNGPLGDHTWSDPQCDPLLAQACFTAPAGATSVTISMDDATTLGSYYIDGEITGVCGPETRPISEGQTIHVTANGPLYGALDCMTTTATVGTFTAVFS